MRRSGSAVAAAGGLLFLALGIYQLTRPHVLTGELGYNLGYDDGVYVGAATQFVHGVLPYRDFVLVHPPGLTLLLSPAALIGRIFGTATTLEIARCLNILVVAINAAAAGFVVRSRGRVAIAVAAFGLAAWPASLGVSRTVELEPWLTLCCLLGAIAITKGGQLASGRRLAWSGVWFGLALDIKVWAIMPIVVALGALAVTRNWRRLLRFAAGLTAAVGVVCGPFFVLAPGSFLHDVITSQLNRHNLYPGTPAAEWVRILTGVDGLPGAESATPLAIALLAVLAATVGWAFVIHRRRRSFLDWFVLALAIVTAVGMRESATLVDHYAYFPAAMLIMLLAVSVADVRLALRRSTAFAAASGIAAVALIATLVVEHVRFADAYLAEASNPGPDIAATIPKGACAISDFPTDLLLADRYTASSAACPAVVDPFGLYLADDGGTSPHIEPPPDRASFVAQWRTWLDQADYLDLRIPYSRLVPFTPALIASFNTHYRLIAHFRTVYPHGYIDGQKDEYIYVNTDPVAGGS